MKKGDKIKLNCIGGKSSNIECIAIYGGMGYYGIGGEVVISGVVWQLLNIGTISLILI